MPVSPPVFEQELLYGDVFSVTTSITLTGSKTVGEGNDLFALINTDVLGDLDSASDNLGNTYTLIADSGSGIVGSLRAYLLQAHDITGGALTAMTFELTAANGAIVATSVEFSGVGGLLLGDEIADGTSAAPEGVTPTGDGLHLFPLVDFHFAGSGGTAVVPDFTPPAGYSVGSDRSALSGSGAIYRAARIAYLIGADSGAKTGAFDASTNWIVSSRFDIGAVTLPTLPAGISMDGVTVR